MHVCARSAGVSLSCAAQSLSAPCIDLPGLHAAEHHYTTLQCTDRAWPSCVVQGWEVSAAAAARMMVGIATQPDWWRAQLQQPTHQQQPKAAFASLLCAVWHLITAAACLLLHGSASSSTDLPHSCECLAAVQIPMGGIMLPRAACPDMQCIAPSLPQAGRLGHPLLPSVPMS